MSEETPSTSDCDTESAKVDSDAEALEKPKKKITRRFEWTEKRREAWAKALETRKKNVQARKDELVADYIKRNPNPKEEDPSTPVSEVDSDSSYEVIVKTKKKPKPKPRQRQVQYESDTDPTPTPFADFEFLWV